MSIIRDYNRRVSLVTALSDSVSDEDVITMDADGVDGAEAISDSEALQEALSSTLSFERNFRLLSDEIEEMDEATDETMEAINATEEIADEADELQEEVDTAGNDGPGEMEVAEFIGRTSGYLGGLLKERTMARAMRVQAATLESISGAQAFARARFKTSSNEMREAFIDMEIVESYRNKFRNPTQRLFAYREGVKKYALAFYDMLLAGIRKMVILMQKGVAKIRNYFSDFEAQAAALEKKIKDTISTNELNKFTQDTQNPSNESEKYIKLKEEFGDMITKLLDPISSYLVYEAYNTSKTTIEFKLENLPSTFKGIADSIKNNGIWKKIDKLQNKFTDKLDKGVERFAEEMKEALDIKIMDTSDIKYTCGGKEILTVEGEKGSGYCFTDFTGSKVKGFILEVDEEKAGGKSKTAFTAVRNFNYAVDNSYIEYIVKETSGSEKAALDNILKSKEQIRPLLAQLKKGKTTIEDMNKKCFNLLEKSVNMLEKMKSANRLEEGEHDKDLHRFLKILITVYKKFAKDMMFYMINLHKDALQISASFIKIIPTKSDIKS